MSEVKCIESGCQDTYLHDKLHGAEKKLPKFGEVVLVLRLHLVHAELTTCIHDLSVVQTLGRVGGQDGRGDGLPGARGDGDGQDLRVGVLAILLF